MNYRAQVKRHTEHVKDLVKLTIHDDTLLYFFYTFEID